MSGPASPAPAPDPARLRADLYTRARGLEDQGLVTEAIATYSEILEQFGEHEDARERRQALADGAGMSLPELLIPERPTAAGESVAEPEVPRLPPVPEALAQEAIWNEMYERALRCERDHRYLTAMDLYIEILEGRGSYKDAALRRSTLVALQRLAEQLYARGVAAESDEEALDNFEQIEVFWPEFRDVAERLRELRGE